MARAAPRNLSMAVSLETSRMICFPRLETIFAWLVRNTGYAILPGRIADIHVRDADKVATPMVTAPKTAAEVKCLVCQSEFSYRHRLFEL